MKEKSEVEFNGGQRHRYKEGEPVERYERVPFDTAKVVDQPPLEFHPKFADRGFTVVHDVTEFIPVVTARMADWWWGNLEKGYHIWAPGEHYGFDWIVPPCEAGYEGSAGAAYVFDPLHPLMICRQNMALFPFTECFEHCCISRVEMESIELWLVHMYQDVDGGILWRTVIFLQPKAAEYLKSQVDDMLIASHLQYESSRLKDFLPQLYELWQVLQDPWENVEYDLTVLRQADGTWTHKYDNLPHRNRNIESVPAENRTSAHTHTHAHMHIHAHENTVRIRNRLARAVGHLNRVKNMVEDERNCTEVLVQLSAVQSALNGAAKEILKEHISSCLEDSYQDNKEETLDELNHLIDTFIK